MKNLYSKKINNNNLIKNSLHTLVINIGLILSNPVQAGVPISQFPLITAGGAADNLVLVPSVEWPTINSVANLGEYISSKAYLGYFDSKKCYKYNYSPTEADRHFEPVDWTEDHTCKGNKKEWSGN